MYIRNLTVKYGETESTERTVYLGEKERYYELVVYNGSNTQVMILTVGNVKIYIPPNAVLDEAFVPFNTFNIAGTGTDIWSWYVRS